MNAATFETGRMLPKFVTPADVRDLKNRVDPFVRALDAAAPKCADLPASVQSGWQDFSKAWRSYFDEDDSWLHTAAQMDQGEAYERDLARWQEFLAKYKCAESAPRITPSTDADEQSSKGWQKTIRTVAIAGAALAIVLGLRTVLK